MTKAKLIKRSEIAERGQTRKVKPQKSNVQKTVSAVVGWIENQRVQREDPHKAFAALFSQPQTQ